MKLIIIRGASGVGKSTIGKKLAEKLGKGTACVNVDVFPHEMMIDWINIPMKERLKFMYDGADMIINKFLKEGYDVVTDGMYCIDDDLTLLKKMIKLGENYNADIYVFELEANLETIKKRAKVRNREEDIDGESILRRYKIFQKAKYKKGITIDANGSINNIVDTIINEIN